MVRGCCSVICNVIAIWTGDKGPEKANIISAHESLGEQTSRFSKVSLFFFFKIFIMSIKPASVSCDDLKLSIHLTQPQVESVFLN